MQGVEGSFKNIWDNYGIQTSFNGNRTLKDILVSPKDKNPIEHKKRNYVLVQVPGVGLWECIGDSARTFVERFKEHLKTPTPICYHQTTTGHPTTLEKLSIVGREGQGFARALKESIFISVNHPTLNRNIGKYNLPHIWVGILNTPESQVKKQQEIENSKCTEHY